jgi:hypothetical protein
VLPAFPSGSGPGRLVHPTLGTYDYLQPPDEWVNLTGDVIIPPTWSDSLTLTGDSNSLWAGNIRDVTVEERWLAAGGLAMYTAQLAMFLSMFQTPVDPATGAVLWYPNYATTLGYKVAILDCSVAGSGGGGGRSVSGGVSLDVFSKGGFVTGAVSLTMKILGRYP